MTEYGIFAYDLEPPAAPVPPLEPLRHPGQPRPRPRWAPPPLSDGFVRVELDDDYYAGAGFRAWTGSEAEYPTRIFDVPREQYERWVSVRDDYAAMQGEIDAMREDRARWHNGVAPPYWVRKDKPYQVQP